MNEPRCIRNSLHEDDDIAGMDASLDSLVQLLKNISLN